MKLFYEVKNEIIDVKNKRKNKTIRLQVDNGFQKVKIKNLND